ncbi:MAG: GTP-binding protein [Calothrix sp. C42_A2020_038]|nr:GTP-binding protein [Calothrix sp. C42_A2020_038]
MNTPKITVVSGTLGSGKTTWIFQQLVAFNQYKSTYEKILYFSPGTGKVPIDQVRIAAEFPGIKVFHDGQEAEFISQIKFANAVYIEVGFYLELATIAKILGDNQPYRAVAVLPPDFTDSEDSVYHQWASDIVYGASVDQVDIDNLTQIWRVPLSGEVIDEDSLVEFWYEVTNGAYGNVTRAKGIFDVNDGRSIYTEYVTGLPSTGLLELDLPRNLEGRPQRFSGLEVVGKLDEVSLGQTLQDCLLSETAIRQYQQEVKQILLEGMAP